MSDPLFAQTPDGSPPHPVTSIPGDPGTGILLLCDHASNAIPAEYKDLGLSRHQLERHIGYDIGAQWMTEVMAERLGCPALMTNFSRLLIDPNRGEDDPTLVMRLSDGAVVPGNAHVDRTEIERRIARFYRPYDDAIKQAVAASLSHGVRPVIVSMHSFTPVWRGVPRPWHAGILWARDGRLSRALIDALSADPALVIGDNEPYNGALTGDVIDRHALAHGYSNTLIEIRQDLIATPETARDWGIRLANVIKTLLQDPIHRTDFRSSTGQ